MNTFHSNGVAVTIRQISHNFMNRLYPEQEQVLLKMRSSNNLVQQFDSSYRIYKHHHFEVRSFDYRWIAYYLEQSERQQIYEYYKRKLAFQKDEKEKADYEWLCASLERCNLMVRSHIYSQRDINLKNSVKVVKEQAAVRPQLPQKRKEIKPLLFQSVQNGLNSLWRMLCGTNIRLSIQVQQEKTKLN